MPLRQEARLPQSKVTSLVRKCNENRPNLDVPALLAEADEIDVKQLLKVCFHGLERATLAASLVDLSPGALPGRRALPLPLPR